MRCLLSLLQLASGVNTIRWSVTRVRTRGGVVCQRGCDASRRGGAPQEMLLASGAQSQTYGVIGCAFVRLCSCVCACLRAS